MLSDLAAELSAPLHAPLRFPIIADGPAHFSFLLARLFAFSR
jgi:hypothetical protein